MIGPLSFAGAVAAILLSPGPTNTLLATSGATVGVRRSLRLIPAEASGYLISIGLLIFAIGPQISLHPALGRGLRLLCAAWLVLMSWRLLRSTSSPQATPVISFRRVFATTLVNPKALVFALAIFPPLDAMPLERAALWVSGFLGLVVSIALAWIVLGAALGASAPRWVEAGLAKKLAGAVLALFAAMLLFTVFAR